MASPGAEDRTVAELTAPRGDFAQLRGHWAFTGFIGFPPSIMPWVGVEAASLDVGVDNTVTPPTRGAIRVGPLGELPNEGTPVSGGTHRRSSRVQDNRADGPGGSVLNFSFAAALIRVRNRSKDLRRSITVDGAVRPDTASNASSETAKLIRRMPSRISKRMKFPSREETAVDVPLIIDAFMTVGCARRDHGDHLAFDWLSLAVSGMPSFHLAVALLLPLAILPSLSSLTQSLGLFLRAERAGHPCGGFDPHSWNWTAT